MLILTRGPGEQIRIGDELIITVVRITHDTVKIGIEAPADCSIVRKELQDRAHLKLFQQEEP